MDTAPVYKYPMAVQHVSAVEPTVRRSWRGFALQLRASPLGQRRCQHHLEPLSGTEEYEYTQPAHMPKQRIHVIPSSWGRAIDDSPTCDQITTNKIKT